MADVDEEPDDPFTEALRRGPLSLLSGEFERFSLMSEEGFSDPEPLRSDKKLSISIDGSKRRAFWRNLEALFLSPDSIESWAIFKHFRASSLFPSILEENNNPIK